MKERNGQLRYLSIVIGAFLSVGVIVGLTNNLYSLYVIPITTGLGISRGLYSMGITVRYIASAFCNLFLKKRDNRSIASQYISKSYCHQFCSGMFQVFFHFFIFYFTVHPMRE